MLHPAPTTPIDKDLARGVLEAVHPATATTPAYLVVSFPNTDYKLHLEPDGGVLPKGIEARVGTYVTGTIRGLAKRIDVVGSGGKYVEPVLGRPRRLQGRVVGVNPTAGTLTVHAGVPFIVKVTAPGQKAGDFGEADFVAFDVLRGATIDLKS
jgi:hypothetical protein